MFENLRNAIKQKKIPHLAVEGNEKVTKIEYIDGAIDKVNLIFNSFDLLGYEKRSDSVEFYFGKKYLGKGYVADLSGVTVDLQRIPGEPEIYKPSSEDPKIPNAPGNLAIMARGIAGKIKPEWKKDKPVLIPCAVLLGENLITVIKFQYLRLIPSGYLIDDENEIRYKIRENVSMIDILMPDSKPGQGYFIDATGYTIDIKRSVVVYAVDEEGNPIKDMEGKPAIVSIKFAGIIGQQATAEKLAVILSGATGREKLIMAIMGFLAGQILFMVLHI